MSDEAPRITADVYAETEVEPSLFGDWVAHAKMFAEACESLYELIRSDGAIGSLPGSPLNVLPLGAMYAIALRQFQVAVKCIAKESRVAPLDTAVGKFDRTLPNLKLVRDALTHFEDYVSGKGHAQKDGVLGDYRLVLKYAPPRLVLMVGQDAADIDLDVAENARWALYTAVLTATGGLPLGTTYGDGGP